MIFTSSSKVSFEKLKSVLYYVVYTSVGRQTFNIANHKATKRHDCNPTMAMKVRWKKKVVRAKFHKQAQAYKLLISLVGSI